MRPSLFQGTFSWPLFVIFLIFFVPWCWYTAKSIKTVIIYQKTLGVIQGESFVPPTDGSSSLPKTPTSRIGTYTHQAVFKADDNATYQVFTRVRSNPPPFKIGDQVAVYYDKQDPSNAMIGTFSELWFPPLALSFFTLIFFILWFGALVEPAKGL